MNFFPHCKDNRVRSWHELLHVKKMPISLNIIQTLVTKPHTWPSCLPSPLSPCPHPLHIPFFLPPSLCQVCWWGFRNGVKGFRRGWEAKSSNMTSRQRIIKYEIHYLTADDIVLFLSESNVQHYRILHICSFTISNLGAII